MLSLQLTRRYRDGGPLPGLLGDTAARSLAALTPEGRQAFLLVSVEGFSPRQTAQILEMSESRVEILLRDSGAEIGRQIATAVLVIEDEPLIALDLKRLLESLGHSGTIARTRDDALRAAAIANPGLVIADIRLADGSSGLDASSSSGASGGVSNGPWGGGLIIAGLSHSIAMSYTVSPSVRLAAAR